MNCDITMLTLYWSGELSEQEALQIEEHLAECATCRQELAELRAMDEMVTGTPQRTAPCDFVSMASCHVTKGRPSVLQFICKPAVAYPAVGAIAMAAAVLIVIMGPWFNKPPAITVASSHATRQTAMALYTKVSNANRYATAQRASSSRTNFRARTGYLTKRIQLAKRRSFSRSKTYRIER